MLVAVGLWWSVVLSRLKLRYSARAGLLLLYMTTLVFCFDSSKVQLLFVDSRQIIWASF